MWNIINQEKLKQIDFNKAVMNELLGCKTVDIGFVIRTSKELEREYDYVLSYFYDAMANNFKGDIIKSIKNSVNLLCKRINWILINISEYKGNGS